MSFRAQLSSISQVKQSISSATTYCFATAA